MADIQDNNNTHLFLNTVDSANNSFIANVNSLANKLQDVLVLNTLFNPKNVADLSDLAQIDITTLIEDLKKGSVNDSRKLDIDLLRNFKDYDDKLTDEDKRLLWNDPTKQVYYDSIIATFLDGTVLTKVFSTLVNNHHKLYSEVDEWEEFKVKATHTLFDVSEDTPIFGHELFRITDIIGTVGSELASIKLTVAPDGQNTEYDAVFAGVKTRTPTYTWLDTSSTISILAVRAERLIQLSLSTGQLGILVTYIKELLEIFNVLDKLTGTDSSIYKVLDELMVIYNNLEDLLALYAKAEELTELPSLITDTAIAEKNALEALSHTLQDTITSVGDTQTIRVQNTGTLQEQKVITAGTAQINLAKAEADRAKAEADRASSLVGIGAATSTALGLIKVGDNLAITGEGVLSAIIPDNPIATTSTAGTVMVGNGLSITNEGILSTDTVDIPTASTEELGLVKIGNGLSIDDNGTVSAIVPEIQPTSEIYISGTEEDGVIPLSITKPTEDIIIPWNITQTGTKKVFRYTYEDDGVISALSRYAFRLYMNSMETQQTYKFSSSLIANVNGMGILIGGNLYSNKFSVTNPMVDIPLDNNVLVSNVERKVGDYFDVEIYVEKTSGSTDTAYISAGSTFDSKLIRNGGEIASSNIVDFDGVIVRTQAQVNRDLAKPATIASTGLVQVGTDLQISNVGVLNLSSTNKAELAKIGTKLDITTYNENVSYSSTEVDTGKKWAGGRTIYRKFFTFGTNTHGKTLAHGIDSIDLRTVIISGTSYRSDTSRLYPLPTAGGSDYSLVTVSNTNIVCSASSAYSGRYYLYVILEYCKTT